MTSQTPPETPADRLKRLKTLFDGGQITAVWAGLAPLLNQTLPEAQARQRAYLQLGCALYRTGDMAAAHRLNRRLPPELWTTMRYRLSLRLRDPLMAARLRRAKGLGPRERADFECSAGLHQLWRHHYASGFRLYRARSRAINFPRLLPDGLEHVPLPDDPADDLGLIVLEQGVGDILFYLNHIKALGRSEKATFLALPRYRALIEHLFPDAGYAQLDALPENLRGARVHLAADFLGRAHGRNRDLNPRARLCGPLRGARDAAWFGICWRGGSGQNRREERHIPLPYLLDMLPEGARYVPLQFDITEDEQKLIAADARCQMPVFDITRDPEATLQLIRGLAGVISVDSANWHFAGVSGVPTLAIMNRTAHWFWGPLAQAESVYPNARTVPKEMISPSVLDGFVQKSLGEYRGRPVQRGATADPAKKPLFVLGLPRSGTSMTMRILGAHGLWLGETVPGTRANPHGFFENAALKDNLVKGILRVTASDPNGVTRLPDPDRLPLFPDLAGRCLSEIRRQGYEGGPWGFKDPKLTLLWPLFAQAFPEATFLIVERDRNAVIDSLCRTHFMARHSASPDYWEMFCKSYDWRLDRLQQSGLIVHTVRAEQISAEGGAALEPVLTGLGLDFDPARAAQAIDPALLTVPKG